jgi:hypothetical protein
MMRPCATLSPAGSDSMKTATLLPPQPPPTAVKTEPHRSWAESTPAARARVPAAAWRLPITQRAPERRNRALHRSTHPDKHACTRPYAVFFGCCVFFTCFDTRSAYVLLRYLTDRSHPRPTEQLGIDVYVGADGGFIRGVHAEPVWRRFCGAQE